MRGLYVAVLRESWSWAFDTAWGRITDGITLAITVLLGLGIRQGVDVLSLDSWPWWAVLLPLLVLMWSAVAVGNYKVFAAKATELEVAKQRVAEGHEHIAALEAALSPVMDIAPALHEGSERGATDIVYVRRAQLDVTNLGGGTLKDCRVRLLACKARIDDHLIEEFNGQSPYFRWVGKSEGSEACDIQTSHAAEIAVGTSDTRGPIIVGARAMIGASLTVTQHGHYPLHDGQPYYLDLEVTASNSAPVIKTFRLQFDTHTSFEAD